MVKSNLVQPRLNLEVEIDEDNGETTRNDYPKHGICPTDPETRDRELKHREC